MPTELKVTGMMCGGCTGSVENAVGKLDGVTSVKAVWEENKVTVEGGDTDAVKAAITKAGFKVEE